MYVCMCIYMLLELFEEWLCCAVFYKTTMDNTDLYFTMDNIPKR